MVGLLLITHNQIGTALLDTATDMLGMCPLMVEALPVKPDCEPEAMVSRGRALVRDHNRGDGVPMLVRVMNYPLLSLPDLADKAESGGRDGIFPYVPRNER